MRKWIVLTSALSAGLLASSSALAALNGPYLGGQLGWGDIYKPQYNFTIVDGGTGGFSGRIFLGYQFTKNWALETGYTKFPNTSLSVYEVTPDETYYNSIAVNTFVMDLVAKAILPLKHNFNLYAKLGIAYLSEFVGDVELNAISQDGSVYDTHIVRGSLLPTFGLGAAYEINPNLSLELSWMRIQTLPATPMDSTDLVALGFNYYFG